MNRLVIKLNAVTENVTAGLISKLYTEAKAIKDYEELNDVLDSQVELLGNLLASKAYDSDVTYLETKFPNLHINITGGRYVKFLDPVAQAAFSRVWGDGNGITMAELNAIGNSLLGHSHWEPILNDHIVWLDEFKYTSVTSIWSRTFYRSLYWINLLNVTTLGSNSLAGIDNLCSKLMAHCENLTTLGAGVFRDSKFENNNTIIMPPNLTSFNSMFHSWLSSPPPHLYFQNTTPPTFVKSSAFDGCTMHVPVGCINVYKQAIIDAGYSSADFLTWLEYDWETDPDGWLDPVVIPDSL